VTALALLPAEVGAHAFVGRSEPRSAASLAESPPRVRIWFDGPVETMFFEVRVGHRREGSFSFLAK
jgi:methionine-rich copper-binding protein CopC